MSLKRLFDGKVPFDMASYPTSALANDHPNTRSSKRIQKNKKVPTTKHANNYASIITLKGRF
jgi:hypothetical protein